MAFEVRAQTDTTNRLKTQADTSSRIKTLIHKVIENLEKPPKDSLKPATNEVVFQPYEGLIIRNIVIERIPFGVTIGDTSKRLINSLTNLANDLHHITKTKVIRENLFF